MALILPEDAATGSATLPYMQPIYFAPYRPCSPARERGCYTCSYFQGRTMASHVVCERTASIAVIGAAWLGCAFWQREPGADDE